MKKKLAIILSATLTLGLTFIPSASADGMTSEEQSINLNVVYAEQILYCDSALRFKKYEKGLIYDNNGSCIDPTEFVQENGWGALLESYQGGLRRWHIEADDMKSCDFFLYHGDPMQDSQILIWDTFFTACSVRLNQPVSDKWVMYDAEFPDTSPVISACDPTVPDFAGYENNCLNFARRVNPLNNDIQAGTGIYINKAANILKKKFYGESKAWLSYNRKANQMYAVVSKTPAGAKVYIQKNVDGRWLTVRTGERFWEGRSFVFYNKASAGQYRILIKTVTGQKFISKQLVV